MIRRTAALVFALTLAPALVHAQPLRLPPAGVPCEAKGGILPDPDRQLLFASMVSCRGVPVVRLKE